MNAGATRTDMLPTVREIAFAQPLRWLRRGTRPLVALGLLQMLAATAWVLVSALLFKLFVTVPLDSPVRFLRYAVAGQGGWLFLLWLMAGGLGAALVVAALLGVAQ